jgi:hypothetical protein
MAIDRVLVIMMALAIAAIVLITIGQAIGQFDSVLKAVLRPPKDEPYPESVRSRVNGAAAVLAAVAALSLLVAFLTR